MSTRHRDRDPQITCMDIERTKKKEEETDCKWQNLFYFSLNLIFWQKLH